MAKEIKKPFGNVCFYGRIKIWVQRVMQEVHTRVCVSYDRILPLASSVYTNHMGKENLGTGISRLFYFTESSGFELREGCRIVLTQCWSVQCPLADITRRHSLHPSDVSCFRAPTARHAQPPFCSVKTLNRGQGQKILRGSSLHPWVRSSVVSKVHWRWRKAQSWPATTSSEHAYLLDRHMHGRWQKAVNRVTAWSRPLEITGTQSECIYQSHRPWLSQP